MLILWWGNKILQADFPARQARLKSLNKLEPTSLEWLMGFTCLVILLINTWLKFFDRSLIFMFNPCHITNLFLVVVCLRKHSRLGELCALAVYSFAFGGFIGIIFNENEGFTPFETIVYHIEHAFASWLGPLLLSLAGRYEFLSYVKFPLPWFGFVIFSVYQRYVLASLSAITWANLNHTLCGIDNDPFYAFFDLGKTYFFWADAYLLFSCMVGYTVNFIVQKLFFAIFGAKEEKPKRH